MTGDVSSDFELKDLYEQLGNFYPKDSEKLYKRALTHSSVTGRLNENYEQLEFLGDAVLSLVTAKYLYTNFPSKNEGELSKMRAFIVSRTQLNKVAKEINLHQYINHQIDSKQIKQAKDLGGDVIEALIGALFLDNGMESTKKFIHRWVLTHNRLSEAENVFRDPKSKLHEWAQKKRKKLEFKLLNPNISNPDFFEIEVYIDGIKFCSSKSSNKKSAEKEAASAALRILYPDAR